MIPRLFEWPPVRSPAHALERLSLALLVGGALFEFVTGIINIQYWYAFRFFFTHGALLRRVGVHRRRSWPTSTLKFGTMRRSLKTPRRRAPLLGGESEADEPVPTRARVELAP